MKGWLLTESLLVLFLANAIAWFVVAMGWRRVPYDGTQEE